MTQQAESYDNHKLGDENFICFPTDDMGFQARFNFGRMVEQKPSFDIAEIVKGKTIAVHVHLFYLDLLPEIISYLNNIPCTFDLFVSIPDTVNYNAEELQEALGKIEHIGTTTIKRVPNRGRDIAPMLCSFKTELQKYNFMLHIQTKKSSQDNSLEEWRKFVFNHLLHSKEGVTYILQRLNDDVGIIAPPDYIFCYDATGWTQNMKQAQEIIDRSKLNISLEVEVPTVKFPQGSMFWCKTDYIKELFNMEWEYKDFPTEPLPLDGTMAHALERLLFLWGTGEKGKCCMIYNNADEMYLRARVEKEMHECHSSKNDLEKEKRKLLANVADMEQVMQKERIEHKTYSEETSIRIKQQLGSIEHLRRKVRKYKRLTYALGTLATFIATYSIICMAL